MCVYIVGINEAQIIFIKASKKDSRVTGWNWKNSAKITRLASCSVVRKLENM